MMTSTLTLAIRALLGRPMPASELVTTKESIRPVPLFAVYGELCRQLEAYLPNEHNHRIMHDLLYIADILHIARTGYRMFENQFVATVGGPALPVLWQYQEDAQKRALALHPDHEELLTDEMRATIADVVRKLGSANPDIIRRYSQAQSTAWALKFHAGISWCGTRTGLTIDTEAMENEVRRRYQHNALSKAA